MPSVAAWLLARPLNTAMALAVAALLPILTIVGGAILVLVVLQQDVRRAVLVATLAAGLVAIAAAVTGMNVPQMLLHLGREWLPVIGLAAVLRSTRSLTLALQVSVLVTILSTVAFFAFSNDIAAFWQQRLGSDPVLQSMAPILQDWQSLAGLSDLQLAGVLTAMFAVAFWLGATVELLLGYWLFQQVPGNSPSYGRFSDLNFGRVIAVLLAVTSVIGFVINVMWIQTIAFILFTVFWLQGAAMVHWLHRHGKVPTVVVVATYVLSALLPQFVFLAVSVLGYTDAWFDFRKRVQLNGK